MKIICLISVLVFFSSSCRDAEPAIYYIPKNFEGIVAVIYSQSKDQVAIISKGRREFHIPENGILFTNNSFSDGWRDDIFLRVSDKGFDTLSTYLPNKNSTKKTFDEKYYQMYTDDSTKVAVNFRQIVNPTFNKFDSSGQ